MARGAAGAASPPPPWMPRNDLPSAGVPMPRQSASECRESAIAVSSLDCSGESRIVHAPGAGFQRCIESEGRLHRVAAVLTIGKLAGPVLPVHEMRGVIT